MFVRPSFVGIGAICGFIAVASGAFGAHALNDKLSDRMLEVFDLAADYLIIHALALILIGILESRTPEVTSLHWAGNAMFIGICVFSGSLFALSLSGISQLGMITPFGGVLLLIGWLLLAWSAFQQRL